MSEEKKPFETVSQTDFDNETDFFRTLELAYHEANGLTKREQAAGLLSSIAHSAYAISQAVASGKSPPFTVNPISGLAFQMECILELMPIDQEDVDARQKDVINVYYLTSDIADRAIREYHEQGIEVEKVLAVKIDGEDRYVLRCTGTTPEVAEKFNMKPGHLLYYPKQDAAPVSEASWNPFYVEPEEPPQAANDEAAEITQEFGDQPFVGAGSDPVIVEATFKEGDATIDDITPPSVESQT